MGQGCFGNLKPVREVEFKCYINARTAKADWKTAGMKDLCLDITEENTYVMNNENIYNNNI